MAADEGFRVHRERKVPLVDDGVEEHPPVVVKQKVDYTAAIIVVAFFALWGWMAWLWWGR